MINQDSVFNIITQAMLENSSELLSCDIGYGMYNSYDSTLQHLPGLDMDFKLYIKYRRLISVNKSSRVAIRWGNGYYKQRVMKLFMRPISTDAAVESFYNLPLYS